MMDWGKYLTDEEQKEIVEAEFRQEVRRNFDTATKVERAISNLGYRMVEEIVNESILGDESLTKQVAKKVQEIIANLSHYSVFHSADRFGSPDTEGQKILNKTVIGNRALIEDRVKDLLAGFDVDQIRDVMRDQIDQILQGVNR